VNWNAPTSTRSGDEGLQNATNPVGDRSKLTTGTTTRCAAKLQIAQLAARWLSQGDLFEGECFGAQHDAYRLAPESSIIPRAWPGMKTLKNNASSTSRIVVNARRMKRLQSSRIANRSRVCEVTFFEGIQKAAHRPAQRVVDAGIIGGIGGGGEKVANEATRLVRPGRGAKFGAERFANRQRVAGLRARFSPQLVILNDTSRRIWPCRRSQILRGVPVGMTDPKSGFRTRFAIGL
jgi:hypothetical protein